MTIAARGRAALIDERLSVSAATRRLGDVADRLPCAIAEFLNQVNVSRRIRAIKTRPML
jgi:hypothetical protein